VPSTATLTSTSVSKNKQTECPSLFLPTTKYNGRIWIALSNRWNLLETASGVSQTFGSSTDGKHFSESYTVYLYLLLHPPVTLMIIDPVISILLTQQMSPLSKFGGAMG